MLTNPNSGIPLLLYHDSTKNKNANALKNISTPANNNNNNKPSSPFAKSVKNKAPTERKCSSPRINVTDVSNDNLNNHYENDADCSLLTTNDVKRVRTMSQQQADSFLTDYNVGQTIGQGGFAKVKVATHIYTHQKVAIKIVDKTKLTKPMDVQRLHRELCSLKILKHPNICQLYEVCETKDKAYIIMEYAPGGELFDYIVARQKLKEPEARKFFRQIVSAVAYCHSKRIIHRDLKPENLLLDEHNNVKLIDFGLVSRPDTKETLLKTCCGSPAYAAPELVLGKTYIGEKADMWSLGVLLFALLCGFLPFDNDDLYKLYQLIQNAKYSVPDWVSKESVQLIESLLEVDPEQRISCEALLRHPWLYKGYDKTVLLTAISPYENAPFDEKIIEAMSKNFRIAPEELKAILRAKTDESALICYNILDTKKREQKQQKKTQMLAMKSVFSPKTRAAAITKRNNSFGTIVAPSKQATEENFERPQTNNNHHNNINSSSSSNNRGDSRNSNDYNHEPITYNNTKLHYYKGNGRHSNFNKPQSNNNKNNNGKNKTNNNNTNTVNNTNNHNNKNNRNNITTNTNTSNNDHSAYRNSNHNTRNKINSNNNKITSATHITNQNNYNNIKNVNDFKTTYNQNHPQGYNMTDAMESYSAYTSLSNNLKKKANAKDSTNQRLEYDLHSESEIKELYYQQKYEHQHHHSKQPIVNQQSAQTDEIELVTEPTPSPGLSVNRSQSTPLDEPQAWIPRSHNVLDNRNSNPTLSSRETSLTAGRSRNSYPCNNTRDLLDTADPIREIMTDANIQTATPSRPRVDSLTESSSSKKQNKKTTFDNWTSSLRSAFQNLSIDQRYKRKNLPRVLHGHFGIEMTSTKSDSEVLENLADTLIQLDIQFIQKEPFLLICRKRDNTTDKVILSFEMEVCQVAKLNMIGVRLKKLKGDLYQYRRTCEDISNESNL